MTETSGLPSKPSPEAEALALRYVDLAHPRLGSEVVYATDDFFADKARMIDPAPPVFYPDLYDDNGKWMDGWESRRKREPGHDHAILRLGRPGLIRAVDIDTSHFTGNYAPAVSLDACVSESPVPGAEAEWREILTTTTLAGDSHSLIHMTSPEVWTHLRLNIYPDGGVARLRVFGEIHVDWAAQESDGTSDGASGGEVELSSMLLGGRAIAWSDAHYGTPNNILAPGRGVNMGDGWETRRRRGPGNDWIIVALARSGRVTRLEVDTAHFKGNYPDRCSVQGGLVQDETEESLVPQSNLWDTLLSERKLEMDQVHTFDGEVSKDIGPVSHLRLNIYPDGGISRFRVFGYPDPGE
jgi:allantoicase